MRTFTLVMGTFNLEVEEKDGSKNYSAKCEKVGFSVDRHCFIESLLFPFCKYLANKHLKHEWSPSKLVYKGFTLELSRHEHPSIYIGTCKEIEFDDHNCLDELVDTFLDKVDEYLEKTMKPQFTVVYEGFTLKVWQKKVLETTLWCGKCKAINFKEDHGLHYLDTLVVNFFQEAVDEYLKPTEIEYQGYKLEVFPSKEIENKFEGYSDICDGWTTLQSTKEEVIEAFKVRVDATHRINIQSLESAISSKQMDLEVYLKNLGYKFDTVYVNSEISFLYAIHPSFLDKWKVGNIDFSENQVVFIRQQ